MTVPSFAAHLGGMPWTPPAACFRVGATTFEVRLTFLITLACLSINGYLIWRVLSFLGHPQAAGEWPEFTATFVFMSLAGIVAHELGHVLAGRCFGLRLTRVVLGGCRAMVRLQPDLDPISCRRIAVSQAGPLAGAVLGLFLVLGLPVASAGWVAGTLVVMDSAFKALVPLTVNSDAAVTYRAAWGLTRRAFVGASHT